MIFQLLLSHGLCLLSGHFIFLLANFPLPLIQQPYAPVEGFASTLKIEDIEGMWKQRVYLRTGKCLTLFHLIMTRIVAD